MQVLCKLSNTVSDVRCRVCGQGFLVYWSRTSKAEQDESRRQVVDALASHHAPGVAMHSHPQEAFNVPDWSGSARFSGAALLSGADNVWA